MTTPEERAQLRAVVKRGYDAISNAYRSDGGASNGATHETTDTYASWVEELAQLLPAGGRVLDLGCGAGVPATLDLTERGFDVIGLDISEVQIERARRLVPGATFVCADMTEWQPSPNSSDAIISLYSLIHVPVEDQRRLIPRLRRWLVDDGYLLAIVGAVRWTGIEDYFGADMFWDHTDTATYLAWFSESSLEPQWHRFVPEGDAGHSPLLACAV